MRSKPHFHRTAKALAGAVFLHLFLSGPLWGAGIERAADGRIQVEDLKLGLVLCDLNWNSVEQKNAGVVSFLGEGGEAGADGIRRDGEFRFSETLTFKLTETIHRISDHESRIQYRFLADQAKTVELFCYEMEIPFARQLKTPVRIGDAPQILPDGKKQLSIDTGGKTLTVPLKSGVLEIRSGKRQVILTETSWNTLRIRLVFGYRGWKEAKLDLTLKHLPYEAEPVDLATVMNMGFQDPVPDDRKGGWTDQGPDNDLSMMKPGRQTLGDIPFEIVDPVKNRSFSCLAMKGGARPYFAERATVETPPVSGRSLYLLNGLAWAPPQGTPAGKVIVGYADGSRQEQILICGVDTGNFWHPRDLENANVVWNAQNRDAVIGLYATRIPLRSQPVTSLEFVSQGQVWMILAATVGTFEQRNAAETEIIMQPGPDWVPLAYELNTEKGSIADLSFLLDAPAGKHGFLKARGAQFEFEHRPGVPVRFWGCNITTGAQWAEEESATLRMLDDIAACGYNVLRFHHFDYGLTNRDGAYDRIVPERMKKLDFLFAEAKKRGIYLSLDLFTIRWPKIPKYKQLNPTDYKVLCYFDPEVRSDLIRFAKELLGHANEYTGIRWADDPALALVNLINEGTLPVLTGRLSERCRPVVEQAFQDYVAARNLTVDNGNRDRLFDEFLTFTGKEFFDELKRELDAIGLRIPLSDQNFANPAGDTRAHYDYVDTHFYWCHPTYIGKEMWKLPSYTPAGSPVAASAGGIRDVLRSRIAGKPMVVSEWNYCYPNPHFFEGAFLTAAYGSFHDFSGFMQFNYAGRESEVEPTPLGAFLLINNPVAKLAARAGALLFLRRDVRPSEAAALITPAAAKVLGAQLPLYLRLERLSPWASKQLPVVTAPGETVDLPDRTLIPKDANEAFHAALKVAVAFPEEPLRPDGTIASATGELRINPGKERFQIVTARSEAVLMAPGQQAAGQFLAVRNGRSPAALYVGSLDGEILSESERILLLHLTDLKNAGAVFGDRSLTVLKDFGTPQLLLRRNRIEVELTGTRPARLFACDPTGKRLAEIPLAAKDGKWSFSLENDAGETAVLLYELAVSRESSDRQGRGE